MEYKMFNKDDYMHLRRKEVFLEVLRRDFPNIEFKNFEKANLRIIQIIRRILKYFQNTYFETIFDKLNIIEVVEDEEPLGGFSHNVIVNNGLGPNHTWNGRIRLSLKIFGEYLDEKLFSEFADRNEVNKWVYPERIFIHELIHYLMLLAEGKGNYGTLFWDLERFVDKHPYGCRDCCPNLTLKKRKVKSSRELTEEFVCEVISTYLKKIIDKPDTKIIDIFDKDKLKYCIMAINFYRKMKDIIIQDHLTSETPNSG